MFSKNVAELFHALDKVAMSESRAWLASDKHKGAWRCTLEWLNLLPVIADALEDDNHPLAAGCRQMCENRNFPSLHRLGTVDWQLVNSLTPYQPRTDPHRRACLHREIFRQLHGNWNIIMVQYQSHSAALLDLAYVYSNRATGKRS